MKKFLRDVFLFSTLVFLSTTGIIVGLNYFVETEDFYKIDDSIQYIVVGDSHAECAYNDSIIDRFKNFAQSGESYFYTYLKTKEIIAHNPNIKTVFIEFNNGQIIKYIDNCIWDDTHIASKFPKYAIAMDWSDYYVLVRNNPSGLFNAQALSILRNKAMLNVEDRTIFTYDWGAYNSLTNNGADKLKEFKDVEIVMDTVLIEISETNIEYLLKTIKVCKERNIEVVLIRSPVHAKYTGRQNELTFRQVQRKYLSGIEFLDYRNYILEDNQYADLHHMNKEGALQFSLFFNELLSRR